MIYLFTEIKATKAFKIIDRYKF